MESLACGTPVVGFNTGGIPEMVDHLQNGYIAEQKNSMQLSEGIYWVLNSDNYDAIAESARKKVITNFSQKVIATKYAELLNRLLK